MRPHLSGKIWSKAGMTLGVFCGLAGVSFGSDQSSAEASVVQSVSVESPKAMLQPGQTLTIDPQGKILGDVPMPLPGQPLVLSPDDQNGIEILAHESQGILMTPHAGPDGVRLELGQCIVIQPKDGTLVLTGFEMVPSVNASLDPQGRLMRLLLQPGHKVRVTASGAVQIDAGSGLKLEPGKDLEVHADGRVTREGLDIRLTESMILDLGDQGVKITIQPGFSITLAAQKSGGLRIEPGQFINLSPNGQVLGAGVNLEGNPNVKSAEGRIIELSLQNASVILDPDGQVRVQAKN